MPWFLLSSMWVPAQYVTDLPPTIIWKRDCRGRRRRRLPTAAGVVLGGEGRRGGGPARGAPELGRRRRGGTSRPTGAGGDRRAASGTVLGTPPAERGVPVGAAEAAGIPSHCPGSAAQKKKSQTLIHLPAQKNAVVTVMNLLCCGESHNNNLVVK